MFAWCNFPSSTLYILRITPKCFTQQICSFSALIYVIIHNHTLTVNLGAQPQHPVKFYILIFIHSFYCVLTPVTCFACVDARCPDLLRIFNTSNSLLYERDNNGSFPKCSDIVPPASRTCTVCFIQPNITIICSKINEEFEVEHSEDVIKDAIIKSCKLHVNILNITSLLFVGWKIHEHELQSDL